MSLLAKTEIWNRFFQAFSSNYSYNFCNHYTVFLQIFVVQLWGFVSCKFGKIDIQNLHESSVFC